MTYSYEEEERYYSRRWPTKPLPYLHLEQYLRCWINCEDVFNSKRVLDIGAGECVYSRVIAEKFAPKALVACELFRERMLPAAIANTNANLSFVAGDCFKLPFKSGSFDVVYASLVLHQLPNLQDVLNEVKRVLSSGGTYIGWEPNPFNPVLLYRYFFRPHSRNQYLFWPYRAREIFESIGFKVSICYFYPKYPMIRSRFLGSCVGMIATR